MENLESTWWFGYLFGLLIGLAFFNLMMLVRNRRVHIYLTRLQADIYSYLREDVAKVHAEKVDALNKDTVCKREYLDSSAFYKAMPAYNRILWKFWIWNFDKFGTLETIIKKVKK